MPDRDSPRFESILLDASSGIGTPRRVKFVVNVLVVVVGSLHLRYYHRVAVILCRA